MKKLDKEDEFWNLVNLLNNCKLLENIILMGSWVEYLYEDIFDFESRFITNDLDIYYKNLYFKKLNKTMNFKEEIKKLGYHIDIDRIDNITKIFNDSGFEVDFLTKMVGVGNNNYLMIEDIGIISQSLRNLEIIDKNTMQIEKSGFKISIPTPSAYIIQKLIINDERKPQIKKEKDIEKINYIFDRIISNNEKEKSDFIQIYNSLTKKQKEKVVSTCKSYNPSVLIFLNRL